MKTKLYQLVMVDVKDEGCEQGRRKFIGQVLSLPIPGTPPTIMVRTVPDHPGTLIELPISSLAEYRGRNCHVIYAKVHGTGRFPTDMLRYDSCVPVNFKLVKDHIGFKTEIDPTFGWTDLVVAKVVEGSRGRPAFTDARWRSFWWTVTELHRDRIGDQR